MSLNPVRILTKKGREKMLAGVGMTTGPGLFYLCNAFAVTDVTVNAMKDDVSAFTAGTQGLQLSIPVEGWSNPVQSVSGRTYTAAGAMQFTPGVITTPMTILGIVVVLLANPTVALAYLEFDQPMAVNQEGDNIIVAVELGFQGSAIYIVPRVLPLGV